MNLYKRIDNKEMIYIVFGRNLPCSKSLYLITIIREEYDNKMNVVFASIIKGFFRKEKKNETINF